MEPKEWCTMSVASLGPATLDRPPPRFPNGISRPMDIEQEPSFAKTFTSLRSTFNSNTDILGAAPKRDLSHSRNCFHTLLVVDDIPGTRPKEKSKMLTTGRHIDPLQPSYSLPSFKATAEVKPKFLRETMSVADIDGAQTAQKIKPPVRDLLRTTDIAGAQASWKPRHSRARLESLPHDIMNIGVEVKMQKSLSKRVTDPVAPTYFVNGMEIRDDVKDTKPAPLKKLIPDNHLLQTQDIVGATAKSIEEVYQSRREFRNTNFLGDINGAQADTIKHSIVTKRETNPLNPQYRSLDDGAPLAPPVTCLVPPDIVKVPTVVHKKVSVQDNANEIAANTVLDVASYTDKLIDESDKIGGRPPPAPVEKLRLNSMVTAAESDFAGATATSGRYSQRGSDRAPSSRHSPSVSARESPSPGSSRGAYLSSRKPSLTPSERRAAEERRLDIESVRAL